MSDSQQRLLSTLLSGIPGILVLKNNALCYEVANPAFCQFLGKSLADVIGKTAKDLYGAEDAAIIEKADMEVLTKSRPQSGEYQLKGVEGKRWFQASRSPILDDDGTAVGLLMVAVDITEFKEKSGASNAASAEDDQRLLEAEAKLSELFNQLQAAQTKAAEAEKNVRTLTVKLGDMEIKVAEAERKTKQIAELNEKLSVAEKAAQEAAEKLKATEGNAGQSAELQAALNAKAQEADKLKTEYLAALKQLEELRTWAQQAQYQYGELQKICKTAETARDTFKKEAEDLKANSAASESAKAELAKLKKESDELRAQLQESEIRNAELEDDNTKLKQAKKDIADLLKRINPDE